MTGLIIVGVWPDQARTPRDNDISMCENLGSARGQNFMSDDDAINYLTSAAITRMPGIGATSLSCVRNISLIQTSSWKGLIWDETLIKTHKALAPNNVCFSWATCYNK